MRFSVSHPILSVARKTRNPLKPRGNTSRANPLRLFLRRLPALRSPLIDFSYQPSYAAAERAT
jgi:hypothetical protein